MTRFRNTFRNIVFVGAMLILPGCSLGDVIALTCDLSDDSDHCFQAAAIQSSNTGYCDKIEGKGFSASNPPRDKCYKTIAENGGDYETCEEIKGGFMSYTEEECVTNIAVKNADFDGCSHLWDEARVSCQLKAGPTITMDQLTVIDGYVKHFAEAAKAPGATQNDRDSYIVYCNRRADFCKYASSEVREQADSMCYGNDDCP